MKPVYYLAIFENRFDNEYKLVSNLDAAEKWRQKIAENNWASKMEDTIMPTDKEAAADLYFEFMRDNSLEWFSIEELTLE